MISAGILNPQFTEIVFAKEFFDVPKMEIREDWGLDGRKIPDAAMDYLRRVAVRAVEDNGFGPELVIAVLGLSRSCMYHWLKRYREQGLAGLESKVAPGAAAQVTAEMEQWLRETVLTSTPVEQGYDTLLWNPDILATLLRGNRTDLSGIQKGNEYGF